MTISELIDLGKEHFFYFALSNDLVGKTKLRTEGLLHKIRRSVTDSEANFCYRDEQPGLKNLIHIYQAFSDENVENIVKYYEGSSYSQFKEDLAQLIYQKLSPVQERYKELMADKKRLEEIYRMGSERASYQANKTLRKVYKKIGFLPR